MAASSLRLARRSMHKSELRALKRSLIHGGVAHLFVTRTLAELQDHYEDLENEALHAGCSEVEAATEARARLGEGSVLADEILKRPELKSWAFRWPWVPAVLRQLVILMSLATVPVAVIVGRGPVIVRWCVSTGLAVLLTGAMLLLMTQMIRIGFPL